jgi:predicted dehydrogenase
VFDFRAHFCHSAAMEAHAFGFRLRANAPESQKRFPISRPVPTGKHARHVVEVIEKAYKSAEMCQAQTPETTIDGQGRR